MGKYCVFLVEIEPFDQKIMDYLLENNSEARYALKGNPSLWETHEKDLRELSKKYSANLFILYAEGETIDNNWIKYFKNGKMQFSAGNIVFDDFNEEKLLL